MAEESVQRPGHYPGRKRWAWASPNVGTGMLSRHPLIAGRILRTMIDGSWKVVSANNRELVSRRNGRRTYGCDDTVD
jgi:hypothetical protein